MNNEVQEAINRLRALKLEVIVSTEKPHVDAAVCAIMSTAVDYKNPYSPDKGERGWTWASGVAEQAGAAILRDIETLCRVIEQADNPV